MDPSLVEIVATLHSLQQQIQDLRDTNVLLQASQPQVLTPALHNLQQQIRSFANPTTTHRKLQITIHNLDAR